MENVVINNESPASTSNDTPRFTPESLMKLAQELDQIHKNLVVEHPMGTHSNERYDVHNKIEKALECATWMESQKIESARFVGPFGSVPFKKGMSVKILPGATIKSTAPNWPKEGKVLKRGYIVSVHRVSQGYILEPGYRRDGVSVVNPEVYWAGSGGYWRWVDANYVETVGSDSSTAGESVTSRSETKVQV